MQRRRHLHGQVGEDEQLVEEFIDVVVLLGGGLDVGAAAEGRDESVDLLQRRAPWVEEEQRDNSVIEEKWGGGAGGRSDERIMEKMKCLCCVLAAETKLEAVDSDN